MIEGGCKLSEFRLHLFHGMVSLNNLSGQITSKYKIRHIIHGTSRYIPLLWKIQLVCKKITSITLTEYSAVVVTSVMSDIILSKIIISIKIANRTILKKPL